MIPWALIGNILFKFKKPIAIGIGLMFLIGLIYFQHNRIQSLKADMNKEHTKLLQEQASNAQLRASVKIQNDAITQWRAEGEKQKERVKETSRRISELSATYQKEIDALKNSSAVVKDITLPCNAARKDGSQWMQEEWQKLFQKE